jgi:hypothetical protein
MTQPARLEIPLFPHLCYHYEPLICACASYVMTGGREGTGIQD